MVGWWRSFAFTDSQVRQIGYIGNQFVNDIPRAIGSVIPGGLGIPVEPIYYLPITDTYTILLDGQTITETNTVDVTQFGPGYAVSVDGIPLTQPTQDQFSFSPDGTQLSYAVNSTKQVTLTIATDTLNESYQFQLGATDIGTGQVVSMTVDADTDQLLFNNAQAGGGQYDLEIKRVSVAGENIFVHGNITIAATDTHYLDYGSWNGTGSITLYIDHGSDGTIDETIVLENQIVSESTLYLPLLQRN